MEGSRVIGTELFPYDKFGFRLEFGEKKNSTVCWFECQEHLDKYLERSKLDKRTIKIDYRDGEPTKSSKTDKKKVRQTTGKSSGGSSSGNKRSTKNLDATRNTNRSRKSTKK